MTDGVPADGGWRTQRLRIQQLLPPHADTLFAVLDDPRVGRWIGGPPAADADSLRAVIARQCEGPPSDRRDERWWNFLVEADDVGAVGTLQATVHADWAEVAYVFGPRGWGRGYATEGLRWLVGRLADEGVTELWATVHPDNAASRRLLERVGFVEVAGLSRPVASYDDGDVVYWRGGVVSPGTVSPG